MGQGGDVLEAAISERGAVVPLGGGQPAQDAAEAMVVVVLGEARQSKLGVGYAAEAFAIQNLGLKDGPEGLDLAVGPRRADLCAQVPDVQVSQPLSEQRQHARHPDHERQSVVAHQLQWLTAELEAFIQPFQDGRRLGLGQDAKANYEARMVIDQSNDPGLHVATAEVNEERSLDVDVPELIGLTPLVARSWWPGDGASIASVDLKQMVDVIWADREDVSAPHLGGNSFRVPVGVKPDCDDDHVDPAWDGSPQSPGSTRLFNQA